MNERYKEEAFLRKQYQIDGKSCAAIGKMCGVSGKTVFNWLKRLNIPTRTRPMAMVKKHQKELLKGTSMKELLTDDIPVREVSFGEFREKMDRYHRDYEAKAKLREKKRFVQELKKDRKQQLRDYDDLDEQLIELQRRLETPADERKRREGLKD